MQQHSQQHRPFISILSAGQQALPLSLAMMRPPRCAPMAGPRASRVMRPPVKGVAPLGMLPAV